MNSHYWCIQKKKVFYSLKLVWAFLNNFFSGIGQFMRDMSLPEQNEDILKCMLSSAVLPIPNNEKEIVLDLKPNFPFDSKTSNLIEDYMCRIHKSLKDRNGQGLPLDNYLKTLNGIFRDKRRILPRRMFCGRTYHTRKDLEC